MKLKICSKLPHGLILENPLKPGDTVEVSGLNSVSSMGVQLQPFAVTEIEEDLWKAWCAVHKDFPALVSGALFVAKNENNAKAMGREFEGRKTGLERLKPEDGGVKKANFSEDE